MPWHGTWHYWTADQIQAALAAGRIDEETARGETRARERILREPIPEPAPAPVSVPAARTYSQRWYDEESYWRRLRAIGAGGLGIRDADHR